MGERQPDDTGATLLGQFRERPDDAVAGQPRHLPLGQPPLAGQAVRDLGGGRVAGPPPAARRPVRRQWRVDADSRFMLRLCCSPLMATSATTSAVACTLVTP